MALLTPNRSDAGAADLGKAVRPFVIERTQPTRLRTELGVAFNGGYVAPSTTEPETDAVLTWSASQSTSVSTLDAMGIKVIWPDDPDNIFTELERETHTKRVENPDDPSQFVDVEVIDKLVVKNRVNVQAEYSLDNED